MRTATRSSASTTCSCPAASVFPSRVGTIWPGGGLTEAVALLGEGPTVAFPHALVVVRDYLADDAEALLFDAWPDRIRIAPDEEGRAAVLSVALARCKSAYGDER